MDNWCFFSSVTKLTMSNVELDKLLQQIPDEIKSTIETIEIANLIQINNRDLHFYGAVSLIESDGLIVAGGYDCIQYMKNNLIWIFNGQDISSSQNEEEDIEIETITSMQNCETISSMKLPFGFHEIAMNLLNISWENTDFILCLEGYNITENKYGNNILLMDKKTLKIKLFKGVLVDEEDGWLLGKRYVLNFNEQAIFHHIKEELFPQIQKESKWDDIKLPLPIAYLITSYANHVKILYGLDEENMNEIDLESMLSAMSKN